MNEGLSTTHVDRLRIFVFGVFILFLLIYSRLFYLQIVKGEYYYNQSENNQLRINNLVAPRGQILDRNAQVLATNRPAFNLELLVNSKDEVPPIIDKLSSVLNISSEELKKIYQILNRDRKPYQKKLLYEDLDRDLLAQVAAIRHSMPGLEINVVPVRNYLYPEEFAHVIGYIREINSKQLEVLDDQYLPGDLIGQEGIEKTYEHIIRGKRGREGVIVSADGYKKQQAFIENPVAGKDIALTIDLGLQKRSFEALGDNSGVVLVVNANNGDILSLVSKPAFDPNIFNQHLSAEQWGQLIEDPTKPLHNRAVSGHYAPGSIFKIFMSYAALSENLLTETEEAYCSGKFYINKSTKFHCHKKSGHGHVALEQALAQSCNVYYYSIGQKLGIDRIHDYASLFGFGSKTNIAISGEARGLVPSRAWKKNNFRNPEDQKWYLGETPSVSIGQGALLVTPLQLARALAAIVNGGKLYDLNLFLDQESHKYKKININSDYVDQIKHGLYQVVNSDRGTGRRAILPEEYGVKVAGKTATAQIKSSKFLKGKDSENHAWFIAFAPYEQPEVVALALVEHGGHGGTGAAPVVQQVLDYYFGKTGEIKS